MKKNVGSTDRLVRLILAIVFGALYFTGKVTGTAGIILLVLTIVFVGTALVSFCPLYSLIGLNTCSTKQGTE